MSKSLCFGLLLFSFALKLSAEERPSSAPYISGDTFRSHCDYIFDETNDRLDPTKVVYGNTLFVKTDLLARFFEEIHPQITQPYVLVTHNSDDPIPGPHAGMLEDEKILCWFGQNVESRSHPKLHPIPIGLANRHWPHGNIETLGQVKSQYEDSPKNHFLYMNFAVENNYTVRTAVYDLFAHQSYCTISTPKNHQDYLIDLGMSQFVLSPRGNGLDTHRTWEALYMGALPVVISSALDPLFQGLPVVIVQDWQQVTPVFLAQKRKELSQAPAHPEKLWADYWFKLIDAYKYPRPIQFSIPECKVVEGVPEKDQDFAFIIPGQQGTYVYSEESEYYKDYQRSYFALTGKKGGWDCMRHYEILANGCIPWFPHLEECDLKTMPFLPKELIEEAMHLEGVSYPRIDHEKFNKQRYLEILEALLVHVRNHLTTRSMANYLLNEIHYSGHGKILYLSEDPRPDYLRCCTLIGLKEVWGDQIVDVPKIEHIYKSYPGDLHNLYGKGFSYTKIIDDLPLDRENIEERIRNKEFAFIIYGSVHRGLRYHKLVTAVYDSAHIAYLCGEEGHQCEYSHWPNLFLRESEDDVD